MVKQIIPDLGDPVHKKNEDPASSLSRKWHIALSIYAATMFYSFIHKTLVPMSVGLLGTTRKEYAVVSFEIFWVFLLGLLLHKHQRITLWVQFFMGVVAAFSVKELLLAVLESIKGWLFVSHMLAGFPLLVAIFILLKFTEKVSLKFLGLGFVFFYLFGGLVWKIQSSLGN